MHNELKLKPMHKPDLETRLHTLAKDAASRSKTARLRDVFEHVDAALNAGVSRLDVLAELNRDGFDMTLAGFKSALQRIRKERGDRSPPIHSGVAMPREIEETTKMKINGKQPNTVSQRAEPVLLPENWMDTKLTPAQVRMLTPTQRRKRTDAIAAQFFPNRFKPEAPKA